MYLVDLLDNVYFMASDIYTDIVSVQNLATGETEILDKKWMRPFYLQSGDVIHFTQDAEYKIDLIYYQALGGHYTLRVRLVSTEDSKEHKVDEALIYGLMENFFAE